jgi:protein-tyrosine phosphatase
MDLMFEDINWDERMRLAKGQPSHPRFDPKWEIFQQKDVQVKGLMDRYVNIKPWNHNRVRLNVPQDQLDYVNASTIILPSPSDIAMQGPTKPSIPYVWRMVAEQVQSPAVIVQLTNNVENGTQKCAQYFPAGGDGDDDNAEWTLNDGDVWGDGWQATLRFESVERLSNGAIEKRRLSLHVQGEDEPRTVWYRRWPDFGVPDVDDLDSFLDMMRLSREHSSPTGPRIVHCSAGVGRTGTFIALEHLIRELDVGAICDPAAVDGESKGQAPTPMPDLINKTVRDLRQQRKGMVQSEQQYQFLYHVLKKLWTDKCTPELVDHDSNEDDDDEDKAEGGVQLLHPEAAAGSSSASTTTTTRDNPVSGNSTDTNNNDDDDDGGASVVAPAPANSSSRWRPKTPSRFDRAMRPQRRLFRRSPRSGQSPQPPQNS